MQEAVGDRIPEPDSPEGEPPPGKAGRTGIQSWDAKAKRFLGTKLHLLQGTQATRLGLTELKATMSTSVFSSSTDFKLQVLYSFLWAHS